MIKYLNKNTVTIGVVVVVGIIVLAVAYSWFKNKSNEKEHAQDLEGVDEDIDILEKEGISPTFSDSQFKMWSGQLQEMFSGCGTDNTGVKSIMRQLKNDADVLQLISIYDVRSYDGCNWIGEFGNITSNLPRAMISEVGSSHLETVNDEFNKKEINFRF